MPVPVITPPRYSKRKRAPVDYAEPSDEEGLDFDIVDIDEEEPEFGSRKKARKVSPKIHPKKKAVPAQKPFPFMSLPPELRNQIYKLALTDPNGVHLRAVKNWYHNTVRHCTAENCKAGNKFYPHKWLPAGADFIADYKPVLVPNLLVTSTAIYAEAAAIFWGQPFYVADLATMHDFLYRIRPETMSLLREVTVIAWQRNQKIMAVPVFHLFAAADGLDSLTIYDNLYSFSYRISQGSAGDSDRAKLVAKKLYRDLFPFIEAVIKTRGIEHLQKVLRLREVNFQNEHFYHPPAQQWTEERRKNCEDMMFKEIARIMEHDLK